MAEILLYIAMAPILVLIYIGSGALVYIFYRSLREDFFDE